MFFYDILNHPLHLSLHRYIRNMHRHLPSLRLDFVYDPAKLSIDYIIDCYIKAVIGQAKGNRFADALT